ncbi:secreted RxLR effector protein 161-like [Brassica rapa]|uniref:secreted RxLR effector protein 161-like n=1 Tax=Brassica campestris TaxID=3711 RepID=UPI00142D43F5|nr:secreted RxLR effector protein 161-like [Brassica rapa]
MELNAKFSKAPNDEKIDEKEYRWSIGCLQNLLHTRLDLLFSVGVLSRYMKDPKASHVAALKQILGYLRGICSLGLCYLHGRGTKLFGYSDSSHNVDIDESESTTGHIFYLGESPINWSSTKQEIVALSRVKLSLWLHQRLQNRLFGCRNS